MPYPFFAFYLIFEIFRYDSKYKNPVDSLILGMGVEVQEPPVVSYLLSPRYGQELSPSEPSVEMAEMAVLVALDRRAGKELPEVEEVAGEEDRAEPQSLSIL